MEWIFVTVSLLDSAAILLLLRSNWVLNQDVNYLKKQLIEVEAMARNARDNAYIARRNQ